MNTQLVIISLCFLIFIIYFLSVFTGKYENFTDENFDNIKNLNQRMNLSKFNLQKQLNEFMTNKKKKKEQSDSTEQMTPPYHNKPENFNVYNVPERNFSERFQANSTDIDTMVKNLDNIEEVCKKFEQKINERDEKTADKIRQNMKEQLEKEDEKIQELEELVNVFRQQYLMKDAINNRCTAEKQKQIEDTVENIEKNEELFKDHSTHLKLNVKTPIKEALIKSLKQFHKKNKKKKEKFKTTATDSE